MDAIKQLKQDVRDGKVDSDRLIDLIVNQQRQLETTQRQLEAAKQRIEELEKKLGGPSSPTTAKVAEPFSLRSEEKRQQARNNNQRKRAAKGRRGRLSNA